MEKESREVKIAEELEAEKVAELYKSLNKDSRRVIWGYLNGFSNAASEWNKSKDEQNATSA